MAMFNSFLYVYQRVKPLIQYHYLEGCTSINPAHAIVGVLLSLVRHHTFLACHMRPKHGEAIDLGLKTQNMRMVFFKLGIMFLCQGMIGQTQYNMQIMQWLNDARQF